MVEQERSMLTTRLRLKQLLAQVFCRLRCSTLRRIRIRICNPLGRMSLLFLGVDDSWLLFRLQLQFSTSAINKSSLICYN